MMAQRIVTVATLLAGFLLISRVGDAEEPQAGEVGDPVPPGAGELASPKVQILSGARTTFQESPFVAFSCQASNPNHAPVMFVGYRADSFDPPTPAGQISPIYIVELQREGKWEKHPMGWCGTGIDGIELTGGGSGAFGFAVPLEPAWTAVRVGVRCSPPLDFSTAQSDAFLTAWSEPLTLAEIDDSKSKQEVAETAQPLKCLLRLERNVFHPGEILLLRGYIKNTSAKVVAAPAFGNATQFFVCTPRITTPHGRQLRYLPLAENPLRSSLSSTVKHPTELAPGAERLAFELALRLSAGQAFWVEAAAAMPAEFSLRAAGEYRASFVFQVNRSDGAPQGAWTGTLASDEMAFTVRNLEPSERCDEPTPSQLAALEKLAAGGAADTELLDDLREQMLHSENQGLAVAAVEYCRRDRPWAHHLIDVLAARASSRAPLESLQGRLQLGIDGSYLKTLAALTVTAVGEQAEDRNGLRLFRGAKMIDAALAYCKLHPDDAAPRQALVDAARLVVGPGRAAAAHPLQRVGGLTILLELDVLRAGMPVDEALEILGPADGTRAAPNADDRKILHWTLDSPRRVTPRLWAEVEHGKVVNFHQSAS